MLEVAVLIPAFNCETTVGDVVRGARTHVSQVLVIDDGSRDLPPVLAKPCGARVNAWVCEGVTCLAPLENLENLIGQVSKPGKIQ